MCGDYPTVKNQRFLPPPLTRGGFGCGGRREMVRGERKDTKRQEEQKAETNTNLAGSLAGSTSNSEKTEESGTNELVDALKEALSGDSSTDYLSTITELLGGIM
jgi:hypothetical protein